MTLRLEYTIVFSAVALLLAHLQTFHPQFGPLTFEQSVARNIYDASAVANAVDALQGLVRPEYTVVLLPDATVDEFDAYDEEFESESFVVLNASPDVDAPLPLDAAIVIADVPFAWQMTMEFDASIDGQRLATPSASRHVACALWRLYSSFSVALFSLFLACMTWRHLFGSPRVCKLFRGLLGSTVRLYFNTVRSPAKSSSSGPCSSTSCLRTSARHRSSCRPRDRFPASLRERPRHRHSPSIRVLCYR
jgi:hypothetical protein